jgi:hypothetical protein
MARSLTSICHVARSRCSGFRDGATRSGPPRQCAHRILTGAEGFLSMTLGYESYEIPARRSRVEDLSPCERYQGQPGTGGSIRLIGRGRIRRGGSFRVMRATHGFVAAYHPGSAGRPQILSNASGIGDNIAKISPWSSCASSSLGPPQSISHRRHRANSIKEARDSSAILVD